MIAATGGGVRSIISGQSSLDDVQFTSDGRTMIYTEESGSRPLEIFRATSGGGAGVALTHINDALLANATLTPLEELWVDVPDKSRVHSFITKPPNFTPTRKYPVVFLIHGGPQGAWGESWTYRWNAQVFASAGFVVVQPNPRGSTGYGQKFIDEINGDWGGKPFDDIMAVVDAVAAQPYIDNTRMAAAGASYGGYMVNWINGHTNRFKAIVSHGGVFDLASWARETEEQWFPLWEMKGTAVDNPDLYEKFSPSTYARDFKTPDTGNPRRARFPRRNRPRPATIHRPATAKSSLQIAPLPRRRPLGPEAAKQPAVVSHRTRLDRRMDQTLAGA